MPKQRLEGARGTRFWAVRRKCRCSYYHNHYLRHPPVTKSPALNPPPHPSHGNPETLSPAPREGALAAPLTHRATPHAQGHAGVTHAQGRASRTRARRRHSRSRTVAPLKHKRGGGRCCWTLRLRVHGLRARAPDVPLGIGYTSEDWKGQRWLITRCPAPR